MAFFNEILAGRYNRFLQKFLGMKGRPPAPQLASEMMAVWSLFHGRENRYLEDWRTYGARAVQAAVAAQDTVARFTNPLGSNIVAVVESILISTGAANVIACESSVAPAATVNLATTFTAAGFDPRFQPSGTGTGGAACVLSSANNIPQGARIVWLELFTLVNTETVDLINYENQEITVLPGIDMQFREETLNDTLRIALRWRERPLEESERT